MDAVRLNIEIAAAVKQRNASILFFDVELEYIFPQNTAAIMDVKVPTAVIVPICVPEKPRCFRYCPISGHSTPMGAYVNI